MIDRLMYLYQEELTKIDNEKDLALLNVSIKELLALYHAYEKLENYKFNKNEIEEIKKIFLEKINNAKKKKQFKFSLDSKYLVIFAGIILTFLGVLFSPFVIVKGICLGGFIMEAVLSTILVALNIQIGKLSKVLEKSCIDYSLCILDSLEKEKQKLEMEEDLELEEKRVSGKQEEKKKTYPLIEEKDGRYLISYANAIEKHFDINTSCEQVKSYVNYFFKYIPDLSEENLVNVLKNINSRFIEEIVIESENVVASLGEEDNDIKEKVSSLKERLDSFSYIVELIKIVNAINMRNLGVKRQLKQKQENKV